MNYTKLKSMLLLLARINSTFNYLPQTAEEVNAFYVGKPCDAVSVCHDMNGTMIFSSN